MLPHASWFEAIGLIAASLTTSSFIPQAVRIWRTRSARDVSLAMYAMMTVGTLLWLAYGLLLGSLSLILSNGIGALMVGSVLALKLRDMVQPRNLLAEIVAAEAGAAVVAAPVNSNDILPEPPQVPSKKAG